MGMPMATNILKAGYPLTVWNRTREKMRGLVSMGAVAGESPKDVAEKSDVVITMVADSPDVEQVILGSQGVIEGAHPGLIVVDMSTISPRVTIRIAKELEKKGVKMLDAPVSGGDVGATQGTLSIMVGGPEDAFKECLPIFQVLGKRITYMGSSGSGQITKLCNQVICALNIQAVCEGLMLAAKAGLDLQKMLNVVTGGAASSWMLSNLAPKMIKRDFEPGFKISHQLKDLHHALSLAEDLKIPLPGTALVSQLFRIVEALGMGDRGTSAAIVGMERISGFEIKASEGA
ncbi:NAD(P)-dependent oxidoreductase [Candidatus Bathyarchaeota archaeon]|nr:NAD(P)-dependent oxidoreductase [Candidatus Bathyarchaeota archaeon]MBS7627521.1 NAD(P)-dependent oxidoreductase [Candidatus Bathyarchaeota archaeon]